MSPYGYGAARHERRSRLTQCRSPHTNRQGGAPGLGTMGDGLMEGSITARPLDYFALLVGASVVCLFSGVVATLCVKFEERGLAWLWAACFFGCALVAAYCLGRLV